MLLLQTFYDGALLEVNTTFTYFTRMTFLNESPYVNGVIKVDQTKVNAPGGINRDSAPFPYFPLSPGLCQYWNYCSFNMLP